MPLSSSPDPDTDSRARSPSATAPPSVDITRNHTPASGLDDKADGDGDEEELPEKLRFLLAQSTVYANIIAEKLARETADRRKKQLRSDKRKERKETREAEALKEPARETRRGLVGGREAAKQSPAKTTRRRREPSLLSSEPESESEEAIKASLVKQSSPSEKSPSTRSNGHRQTSNGKNGRANGKTSYRQKIVTSDEDTSDENVIQSDTSIALGKTRREMMGDSSDEEEEEEEKVEKEEEDNDPPPEGTQPKLVTGAKMKSYQIVGMEWLISLYENGLNGILADEMGLGKTLQTIALLAHLREQGVWGPFLVVCPLSTLANWVNEFERFTPTIPTILYHGTPDHRKALRENRMELPTGKKRKSSQKWGNGNTVETFPIIVTSYELVMNDRKYLAKYDWKYIIIDESHRIKNLNCKLIKELTSYRSANRLLLTGTPLQNNLDELWSLLNFLVPEIFDDLDAFKSWFNIDTTSENSASNQIVTKLHAILKPFLLRRVKRDVEKGLPPKKEYLLSAALTPEQKALYDAVVSKQIRQVLMANKDRTQEEREEAHAIAKQPADAKKEEEADEEETAPDTPKGRKRKHKKGNHTPDVAQGKAKRARPSYVEENERQFLKAIDSGEARRKAEAEEEARYGSVAIVESKGVDTTTKINRLNLQNIFAQLRKVVNHPWLFDWPTDPKTNEPLINKSIINSSGKMLLLDKLLTRLFATGHKVLVFSQFTTQLDIIQDWAEEYKNWPICRIDGLTKQEDRRKQLKDFNEKKGPKSTHLFLLTTRAGGVGINLTGADTVILFDSDWNPQMDLQAMDRVHRLGQTKPVLIFRLVTSNTVEARMLERAGAKRRLEALVIGQGNYRTSLDEIQEALTGASGSSSKAAGLAAQIVAEEMQDQATRAAEGKAIRIIKPGQEPISDKQLDMLLDRSPEAMSRGKGWKVDEGSKAMEVIETVASTGEGNDALEELFRNDNAHNSKEENEDD